MAIKVVIFREDDGSIPLTEFLDEIPDKAMVKCLHRMERLQEMGHLLRRPEADFLRDGIYELRVRHQNVNYRLLYFFIGKSVAVIAHGITKEDQVPSREIDRALERMRRFKENPRIHSAGEEL
jgi:phage-related protein